MGSCFKVIIEVLLFGRFVDLVAFVVSCIYANINWYFLRVPFITTRPWSTISVTFHCSKRIWRDSWMLNARGQTRFRPNYRISCRVWKWSKVSRDFSIIWNYEKLWSWCWKIAFLHITSLCNSSFLPEQDWNNYKIYL